MNIFRLVADVLHTCAVLIIIHRLRTKHSCRQISLKSQILFLIVFVCRYLDLFVFFVSLYLTLMKIFFISATAMIVILMRTKYYDTYESENDNVYGNGSFLGLLPPQGILLWFILPCFLLALIVNEGVDQLSVLWAFSIYLEAVAILPQLFMLQRISEREGFILKFLFCLGSYRALYMVNWLYRQNTDPYFFQHPLVWISGFVQTLPYLVFLRSHAARPVAPSPSPAAPPDPEDPSPGAAGGVADIAPSPAAAATDGEGAGAVEGAARAADAAAAVR